MANDGLRDFRNKLKLLYLKQILETYTDKENGLSHENVVYIGDDYGLGGNDESVYKSDFKYLTIDDYRDFGKVVKPLLD